MIVYDCCDAVLVKFRKPHVIHNHYSIPCYLMAGCILMADWDDDEGAQP